MRNISISPAALGHLSRVYYLLVKVSWALLFFCLPFTSFPYFPASLGGRTLVRPLSTYPLLILGLLVILPRFIRRPLPRTFLPLLAFLITALISSLASLSADIDALLGVTLISRLLRSLATLGLGAVFYFTVALLHDTWRDLRFSILWMYAGFTLALAWGSLQALYVIHYYPPYFKLLNSIQSFVSTRKLFTTRISGLTYEPKWFAEQICLLLLPWLLGAILSRQSLFKRISLPSRFSLSSRLPLSSINIEWLLLVWASIVLLFTFSRTGLLILGSLIVLSFLIFRSSPSRQRLSAHVSASTKLFHRSIPQSSKTRILLEVSAVICIVVTLFVVVGSQNPYFSRLWRYYTEAKQRNRTYLEYIAFDQRFTYWQTAYNMFESQPLIGVGLGNYAFYFSEMLPDRLYRQAEVIRLTTPEEGRDRLITPKNLLARLLAETGILGTATFLSFIIAVLGCVLFLWYKSKSILISPSDQHASGNPGPAVSTRMMAISGALALAACVFVILSMDSFARPEIWVVFGLITAAASLPASVSKNAEPVVIPEVRTYTRVAQNG